MLQPRSPNRQRPEGVEQAIGARTIIAGRTLDNLATGELARVCAREVVCASRETTQAGSCHDRRAQAGMHHHREARQSAGKALSLAPEASKARTTRKNLKNLRAAALAH